MAYTQTLCIDYFPLANESLKGEATDQELFLEPPKPAMNHTHSSLLMISKGSKHKQESQSTLGNLEVESIMCKINPQ